MPTISKVDLSQNNVINIRYFILLFNFFKEGKPFLQRRTGKTVEYFWILIINTAINPGVNKL